MTNGASGDRGPTPQKGPDMEYAIWISIEEIDEDTDHYEEVDMPDKLGTFDTLAEAQQFIGNLLRSTESWVNH
jgi:hypothetical protein